MVFLLVRRDSVSLLSGAAAAQDFLESPQGLGRECDGHDNRLRGGVIGSLHYLFFGSRSFSDGLAGAGLLVPVPKITPESSAASSSTGMA